MNFIEKLQNKPKKTRILILWISSGMVMIIIVTLWLVSFSRHAETKNINGALDETKLPSLWESFKQDFSSIKTNISAGLRDLNEQTTKLEELNEGQKTE
jgi:hypothetical protein